MLSAALLAAWESWGCVNQGRAEHQGTGTKAVTCASLPWSRGCQGNSHSKAQSPLVPLRLGQPPRMKSTGEPGGKACAELMEMGEGGGQQARRG